MPSIATKKKEERNLPDKKKMSYMKVDIYMLYMKRVSEQELFE